jgi:hypothetical protein
MNEYTITLKQAKRLDELKASSRFNSKYYWVDMPRTYNSGPHSFLTDKISIIEDNGFAYPAYHVGELGEMLKGFNNNTYFDTETDKWATGQINSLHTTEAICRGALLIYLLENNLI